MKKVLQFLIRFYQVTLSPDHSWLRALFPGGFCPFTPSCSVYMHEAIEKHGAMKGSIKGLGRIFRCNPWSKKGVDIP